MASSLIGRKLGKYDIVELVGQGGMATVYKGYQSDIDRYVAVKVLPPHPGMDRQFAERFRLEARTIARLQHPHILPLYDYGVQDDILYLVMAYVQGGTLSDRIDRGKLPLSEIVRLLKPVAAALDYAHRQGVIHRDIKPDNILLDREGNALLADFGIVKLAEGEARLTVTGGLVGTPAYMAPEQGRGEVITSKADLYSLGVVVYEMITGKKPYTAPTPMQVVLKHMTEPVPSLRAESADVPPALEAVMQRVLAKDPEDRYPSATAFADDFAHALQNGGVAVDTSTTVPAYRTPTPAPATPPPGYAVPGTNPSYPPPGTNPNMTPPPSTVIVERGTNPLLLLGGFGIIAVVLVLVVFLLVNGQRDREPVTAPTTAPEVVAAPTRQPNVAPVAANVPSFGRVSYTTTNQLGDTLIVASLGKLKPPPAGRVYAAWLKNTATGDTLLLGELAVDALGQGTLAPYIDPDGRPLFTLYNAIAITEEPRMSETATGSVVYSASVPPELMDALTAILITSPNGFPVAAGAQQSMFDDYNSETTASDTAGQPTGSLLDGALTEARTGAQHAGMAAGARNVGAMHSHAEHTINILLGTQTDHDGNGRGENPGRGVGVVRFLDWMDGQLDTVANAPSATPSLQSELELIRVCVQNTRQRVDEVVGFEQSLLAASDPQAVADTAAQSTRTAETLINGVDFNGNGQVEPFEGECGLEQIRTFGVLVSGMNLVEGTLPE
ncbi:MAG: serine/threonine protein kinase [Chloroflexi bacterium]|nr:serine/threonine protein kinase [Chloroflexota bacterium]